MSSDAEYAAFLQKSQKDYSGGQSSDDPWGAGNANVTALEDAHPEIKKLGERFYTSEIDEPFTGVSFVWEKAELPTADEFGSLAGASGGKAVETIAPSKWAGGAYKDVVDAVAASSDGNEVGIYRVERTGSRVEYFVLAVARDHKLAGVKVKAVES